MLEDARPAQRPVLKNLMASVFMQTQRLNVDPSVKDLEHKLRVRVRSHGQKALLIMTCIALSAFALIFGWTTATKYQSNPQDGFIMGIFGVVILAMVAAFARLLVRKSSTPDVDEVNNERRKEQRSINRSREIVMALGETVVPTLTKEHVEAGIRFDKAIDDNGIRWKREDFLGIRSLLLEDLSREDAIITLVTERGMVTLSEVREGLNGMELNGKPLQSGWL